MTPEELRSILDRLGLTQSGAARMLEVDQRTMRRWVSGAQDVPGIAALFLRLMDECPAALRWLTRRSQ